MEKQFKGLNEDQKELKKLKNKKSKKNTRSEVSVYTIPFKYSYQAGTPDSLKFLDKYSESISEEFILSDWKEVIIFKWNQHKAVHIIFAIIFWAFTMCTILSMIFFPDSKPLQYVSIGFIFLLLLFEILQLISYATFKVTK